MKHRTKSYSTGHLSFAIDVILLCFICFTGVFCGDDVPETGGGDGSCQTNCCVSISHTDADVTIGNKLTFIVLNNTASSVSGYYRIIDPNGIQIDRIDSITVDSMKTIRFEWDTNHINAYIADNWKVEVTLNNNTCEALFDITSAFAEWDSDGDEISDALETENSNIGGSYYTDPNDWLHPPYNTGRGNHDWTTAQGTPQNGSLEHGLRIANQSTGYRYWPRNDTADTDNWGTLTILNTVEEVARDWDETRYSDYDIVTNDISLEGGGFWDDHISHQNGTDIDIMYVGSMVNSPDDTICVTSTTRFDIGRTSELLIMIASMVEVDLILVAGDIEDGNLDYGATMAGLNSKIIQVEGHKCHFHVRIIDPDGENS